MNSEPHIESTPLEKIKPRSSFQAWLHATRPKTLAAAVAPVLCGTALAVAHERFHLWAALAALFGAVCIQIATNFANEFFDHAKGADRADRKGPDRAVALGWISPRAMGMATSITFGLALGLAALLVARAGWPLLVLGLLSVLCGIGYTAGRYALAYIGLGDLFVVIFFGPVAMGGTYYVQALPGALQNWWPVLIAGLGPGLMINGLLIINNLRDMEEDRISNKRTLAVRLGDRFSRFQYVSFLTLGILVPSLAFLLSPNHIPPGTCLSAAAIGVALPAFRLILSGIRGTALNPLLGKTAQILLAFTALFSVGVLLFP